MDSERPAPDRPKVRESIPLDQFRLEPSKTRGGGWKGWLGAVVVVAAVGGALLFWFRAQPRAEQPVEAPVVDSDKVAASRRAGANVRPMIGTTASMMIVVRSAPDGAVLWVNDEERGETPIGLDTRCHEEASVVLQLRAPGYRTWRRDVPCQPGIELTFQPTLRRSR
ncbi:MAG: PEGA domain-containing protein [Myxococcota bacterium]